MKRHILTLALLGLAANGVAVAQINCTPTATRQPLVCEFPISTGSLLNTTALGNSANPALQVATGLNTAVATQVSQLPLAAASAGSVIAYKNGPNGPLPELINDLGPILTDRAQTVGRHRVFLGATASQFVFTAIDGNSLSNLQWSYDRQAKVNGSVVSDTYTTETVKLKFKINQFVGVGTVGLSKKIDLTAVVPAAYVSLGSSTINIQNFVVDPNNGNALSYSYTTPNSSAAGTASGVGDVVLNLKAKVVEWEHDAVAVSGNVRLPTGDPENFLGSGAWGFDPSLLYSRAGKIAPHLKIGYQWNTNSKLNNPTNLAGGNKALPGGLQYDIGLDLAAGTRVTFVADLLGSQFQNVTKLETEQQAIKNLPQVQFTTNPVPSSYTVSNVATGMKWGPVGGLVLSVNLLTQIDNVGLHSRPTPMLGIAYRF